MLAEAKRIRKQIVSLIGLPSHIQALKEVDYSTFSTTVQEKTQFR